MCYNLLKCNLIAIKIYVERLFLLLLPSHYNVIPLLCWHYLKLCWHTVMEISFISLLNCNQFGWWVEEEDPHPYPPHPKWSSRVGEMSNEEEDPQPLPTPPQIVLTVKNSRWVIIDVFHACLPCTHYTAVPASWDPKVWLVSLVLRKFHLSACMYV